MNVDKINYRRVNAKSNGHSKTSPSSYGKPVMTSASTMGPEKKITAKAILPLSCQRWLVRFLFLQKNSRLFLVLIAISFFFLLPPTVYMMSSPSYFLTADDIRMTEPRQKFRERKDAPYRKDSRYLDTNQRNDGFQIDKMQESGSRHKTSRIERNHSFVNTNGNDDTFDTTTHGMNNDKDWKIYAQRKTFASLQPRVVRLKNFHDVRKVKGIDLTKRERYDTVVIRSELRRKNPEQLDAAEEMGNRDCTPVDPKWQLAYHHTCNRIHEISGGWQQLYRLPSELTSATNISEAIQNEAAASDDHHREQLRSINHGAFRDVWMIRDTDGASKFALKTLTKALKHNGKKFDHRNHDRHRRDALAFETLQSSPLVVNMYASCSSTAVFDYVDQGDLTILFKPKKRKRPGPSNLELLQIAYNISMSVSHAHHFVGGHPTMAHTDIKADQFLYQDGYYKLSDFNRVRFLSWNLKDDSQCTFTVGKNGGEFRSPEEYAYQAETEKVDVFSLGNVLYFLLVRKEVWENTKHSSVNKLILGGQRPKIPDEIYKSDGVFERFMIRAIELAWIHDPVERPSALQVANVILEGIEQLPRDSEKQ